MATLLNDETFEVTTGIFGGMKATSKSRDLVVSYTLEERIYVKQGIEEYSRRGYSLTSDEVKHFIHGSAQAVFLRGRAAWKVFFATLEPAAHVTENLKT